MVALVVDGKLTVTLLVTTPNLVMPNVVLCHSSLQGHNRRTPPLP